MDASDGLILFIYLSSIGVPVHRRYLVGKIKRGEETEKERRRIVDKSNWTIDQAIDEIVTTSGQFVFLANITVYGRL